MGSLFIIGNGFDMAHGIPSKYNDFRNYIVDLFPEALEFRDEIVCLEDCDDIYEDEFAAEILLNTMDKVCGKEWNNFESALAEINFNGKLPNMISEEDWSEDERNRMWGSYLLYTDKLTSGFIACSKQWQEFFRLWIKNIEDKIELNAFQKKESLKELFQSINPYFFTFNYTKTLQVLYGIKKVTHIHNRSGQKLIFGHCERDVMYGENSKNEESLNEPMISSSFLDDMVTSFRKDTDTQLKKYKSDFKKLDCSIDCVYSYGFSYAKVDSVYIKQIIPRISPKATWYFTEFESRDRENLRIKKIKLRRYGFKGNFGVYPG